MKVFTQDNCENLEALYKERPSLFPIYLNVTELNNTTKLKFTKLNGQILYALSEKNSDCIYEMLSCEKDEIILPKITKPVQKEIIKAKTSNIFNFIRKKPADGK